MPEFSQQKTKNSKGKEAGTASRLHAFNINKRTENPLYAQQAILGNQAVQHLLESRIIQPKLKVSSPDDKYEREADRVANIVMRMPEPDLLRQPEEQEELIQQKSVSNNPSEVTLDGKEQINAMRSGGRPLPKPIRAFFEPRFGHDFNHVRVYADTKATNALNARAFTIGRDIVFAAGDYAPESHAGRKLIAHELTHVVQQGQGSLIPILQRELRQQSLSDALGFKSELETLSDLTKLNHPLTKNILRLMSALLVAKFVHHNKDEALVLYGNLRNIFDNMDLTLLKLKQQAPHPNLWFREEAAIRMFLSTVETTARDLLRGRYSEGLENYWLKNLHALDKTFIKRISPAIGPVKLAIPGGKISRKFYLGSTVIPNAIINFYLTLGVQLAGTRIPSGTSTEFGLSFDEEGEASPSLEAAVEGAGGAKASLELKGGEEGKTQLKAGVETKMTGEAGTVGAGVHLISTGKPEAAIRTTNKEGWKSEVKMTADKWTYTAQDKSGAGAKIEGTLDRLAITAMAPELKMGGTVVRWELEAEIQPNLHFWRATYTQTEEAIQAYRMVLLALAAVSLGTVVVGATVATLPEVIVLIGEETVCWAPVIWSFSSK